MVIRCPLLEEKIAIWAVGRSPRRQSLQENELKPVKYTRKKESILVETGSGVKKKSLGVISYIRGLCANIWGDFTFKNDKYARVFWRLDLPLTKSRNEPEQEGLSFYTWWRILRHGSVCFALGIASKWLTNDLVVWFKAIMANHAIFRQMRRYPIKLHPIIHVIR